MPIDASIYGQVQQPQQANPLNALAKAYQIKAYQGAADKSERDTLQQNRLLELVQNPSFSSLPTSQKAAALQGVGAFDQAGKLVTTEATANKDQRAADVSSFELQAKKLEMLSNLAGSVTDQPSYDRARTIAQQQGLDVSQWNPQYDPAGVAQFAQATLTAKERLNAQIQQQAQGVTMRGQDLGAQTAIRGQDLTASTAVRGQDLTNTRAVDANRLKADENEIKRGEKIPENSTSLRKEFDGLPEVKNYKQALPSFKGIEDAVKRNTPMSDINIVYGIAKLYDPNSVVREGEYATVANAPAIPERVKGWAQYIAGGGKLTEEVKKQILTEAKSRMKTFEDEYGKARSSYQDIAKRSNADPSLVISDGYTPALKPQLSVGLVQNGYRYKGGNPNDRASWEPVK